MLNQNYFILKYYIATLYAFNFRLMTDADNQLIETKERSRFFQTVQAWPLDNELNFNDWLNNFDEGEERNIACNILDFFTYYSKQMVNQMLQTSVSKSGYFFSKHFSDWQHHDFKHRCIYSYIPGEIQGRPADSGNLFSRKLRDDLNIPEIQIVSYSDLAKELSLFKKPVPIVFVDDFVGSGQQVLKAWSVNEFDGLTLKEICKQANHCAVYAPLIVNYTGYEVITDQCEGLNLCTNHILGPEYNLFHQDCICWKNDPELFRKGVDLILKKSQKIGIPSTGGADERDEKGYGMQGLALSFEHGAPDAIPAFFYWNSDNWNPLILKPHQR